MADIFYSNTLIQSLETSLSSAFNRPIKINRKRPDKRMGEFALSLVDVDNHVYTNEGTQRPVCEVRDAEKKKTGFYFTFVVEFKQAIRSEYALRHSSLQIFHDTVDLLPLFRAEWDQQATLDTTSPHAQPHWHFVQRPDRVEQIVRSMMPPPREFVPSEQLFAGYADCGDFHFAMSPLWEKDKPNSLKQDYDSSDFPLWFDNLTKYVAAQIAYIVKKAPPMPTKEFAPEEPSA